ncbi:MAG: alpha-L-rhamnosidase, partial [Candidatus Nephrothrix sp. EaCA]
ASAGAIVECLFQEAHLPGNAALMNTHYHSWARFICKEGINNLETFDFESLRWMQVIVRKASGEVILKDAAVRRRLYPYSNSPQINVSSDWLQVLLNACVNTLRNSAQDTIVDGMARERQQYSGDGSHQLHAIYQSFGEYRLPARFVNTFGMGMNSTGVFFHSWPAWDVLARTWERQLSLTDWGNLVDHSIGFCFDVWHYYLYTGDEVPVKSVYSNLLQFFAFLERQVGAEKILPMNTGGIPAVWIDHEAYQQKRHKQCAYNLYAAAMLKHALTPLAELMRDAEISERAAQLSAAILQSTVAKFWSRTHRAFTVNLPWLDEEKTPRFCDRSLSTALLFDMNPAADDSRSLQLLQSPTKELGLSYPCNAVWRYWALAKHGKMDAVLDDFKTRWFSMPSVKENNTIQEFWQTQHDSYGQWSHCAVAPLIILNQYMLGVLPKDPLGKEVVMAPQLSRLEALDCAVYMYGRGIRFELTSKKAIKTAYITVPKGIKAVLNTRFMKLISYNGKKASPTKEIELKQGFRNAIEFQST